MDKNSDGNCQERGRLELSLQKQKKASKYKYSLDLNTNVEIIYMARPRNFDLQSPLVVLIALLGTQTFGPSQMGSHALE